MHAIRPIALSVALVAALAHSPAAQANCPGGPLTPEAANQNPQYLAACQGSPTTCPETPIPTVIVNSHPQEVVLRTSILEGFDPIEIKWRAERYDPVTYTWNVVWEHVSDENLQGAGAYTIDFGAPGLTESTTYAFRVAWRNAGGWLCYSWRSAPVTPTSFSNLPPTPPGGTSYVAEDGFERPTTTFKCNSLNQQGGVGDGLGPQAVWRDCQIGTGSYGPTIGDQGHSARFPPSSVAPYMARHATHRHNFTEAKVRVAENVTSTYNFQVTAREHLAGAPLQQRGYAAKLLYKIRDCATKPSLTIFRLQDEYAGAGCSPSQGNPPLLPWGILIPDANNPTGKCTAMPPLDQVDPATGTSYPVWLRIEVTDENLNGELTPKVIATVAWGNCPAGQGIDSCQYACRATRIDTGDPESMAYPAGGREDRWGMSFHDKTYFVDLFRTGSE